MRNQVNSTEVEIGDAVKVKEVLELPELQKVNEQKNEMLVEGKRGKP